MTTSGDGILAALTAIGLSAFTPENAPALTKPPYGVLYPGASAPDDRMLDGRTAALRTTDRVMVVSNSANGAAIAATRAARALDGPQWRVESISSPLSDRSDPSCVWWSCTLELRSYGTQEGTHT